MKYKRILITYIILVVFCFSSISMYFSNSGFSGFSSRVTTLGSSNSTGTDWPMFMGNLNHTGVTTTTTPVGNNDSIWNYTTGNIIESSPIIWNGSVYFGSDDYNIYCLNASTGKLSWNYTTGGSVASTPAIYNGSLYVGSSDNYTYCLNATTGKLIWKYDTGSSIVAPPTVDNGRVYIGNSNGVLFCLNATNSSSLWNYTTYTGLPIESAPAISNGFVYLSGSLMYLYCINATSGALKWENMTISSYSSPAIWNGSVFVGNLDDYLYSLNASDGSILWQYNTTSGIFSSPAVDQGRVFIGSTLNGLLCLNTSDGSSLWNFSMPDMFYSCPAISNGMVFIGDGNYDLYCINETTGTMIWNYNIGSSIYSSPAIANGMVYVGGDETLFCLPMIMSPSAPINLNLSQGNGTIGLTWWSPLSNGGSPVTSYNIYRGTSVNNLTFFTNVGNVLTYTDTGLTNGQTYYYELTANNSVGESQRSMEASIAPATTPTAPTSFQINAGNTELTLNWQTPSNNGGSLITGYNIYRGTSSGSETPYTTLGNVTSYTDTGLTNGQTYYYEVSANNSIGEGAISNEGSGTPATTPTQPQNVQAVAGSENVNLTWSPPANNGGLPIMGYNIFRGTSSGSETLLTTIGNDTSFNETGLTNGQTYYYKVSANNSIGESSLSSEVNATPKGASTPPENLQTVAGNQNVTLIWSVPSNDGGYPITGYYIYRGTSSGSETLLTTVGSVTSYTNTGLTNGQTYYYEVSANNSFGESLKSNECSSTPATNPGAPTILQIKAGNENINLTWQVPSSNGGSPITGYNIYRGTSSGSLTLYKTSGNVTNYVDTGLTNTQIYYYQVSAINNVGEGSLSNEVNATPMGVSTPPQNLQAITTPNNITLTWSVPSNDGGYSITGYNIYRGTSSGGETFLISVGTVTSYTDTNITSGQTYYYEVSAKNSFGESAKSNECSSTPATIPGAPTNLQVKAGNNELTLTWQAPKNNGGSPIIGYEIYRGTASGQEVYDTTVGNVTSFTDTPLTAGQTYYYTVRAINGAGVGPQSAESGAIPTSNNSIGGMNIAGILLFSFLGLVMVAHSMRKRFR